MFLSNFYMSPVTHNGLTYTNSEAAFQAAKCINEEDRLQFTTLQPNRAKYLGRHIKLRPDWEQVKDKIMYDIVKAKFTQNPSLSKRLINTGDCFLIEGNTWGDTYWGVCNGAGFNKLGLTLMKVREELRCGGH